jgi:hypothetical protein
MFYAWSLPAMSCSPWSSRTAAHGYPVAKKFPPHRPNDLPRGERRSRIREVSSR